MKVNIFRVMNVAQEALLWGMMELGTLHPVGEEVPVPRCDSTPCFRQNLLVKTKSSRHESALPVGRRTPRCLLMTTLCFTPWPEGRGHVLGRPSPPNTLPPFPWLDAVLLKLFQNLLGDSMHVGTICRQDSTEAATLRLTLLSGGSVGHQLPVRASLCPAPAPCPLPCPAGHLPGLLNPVVALPPDLNAPSCVDRMDNLSRHRPLSTRVPVMGSHVAPLQEYAVDRRSLSASSLESCSG